MTRRSRTFAVRTALAALLSLVLLGTLVAAAPASSDVNAQVVGAYSSAIWASGAGGAKPLVGERTRLTADLLNASDLPLTGQAAKLYSSRDGKSFGPTAVPVAESAPGEYSTASFSVAGPVWYKIVWPAVGVESSAFQVVPIVGPSGWSAPLGFYSDKARASSSVTIPYKRAFTVYARLYATEPGVNAVLKSRLEASTDGLTFVVIPSKVTAGSLGTEAHPTVTAPALYRFVYEGDAALQPCASAVVRATPQWNLSRPVVPSRVRRARRFTVKGTVLPGSEVGAAPDVKLVVTRRSGRRWVKVGTYRATVSPYAHTYQLSLRLKKRGTYRVYAKAAGVDWIAGTTTPYASFAVR